MQSSRMVDQPTRTVDVPRRAEAGTLVVSRADQQSIGANSYNQGFPWAFRCTWDRSAVKCPYPAYSFGRALSWADVERMAVAMMANQLTGAMPLLEVAAMGPDSAWWTVVVRYPQSADREKP